MTAPTTRETADPTSLQKMQTSPDHAELVRLAEMSSAVVTARGDVPREECLPINPKNWSGAAHAEILAAHRLILLSEIAALRGERDEWRVNYDRATRLHASTCRDLAQAERQRDELRKALGDIQAMTDADDPDSYRSDDREGCLDAVHDAARQALANQGADQ